MIVRVFRRTGADTNGRLRGNVSSLERMPLIVDVRERDLIPLLGSDISQRNLPVGDIWIGLSGEQLWAGSVVAERKCVADLEASILDGRYREQRTRLLSHCATTGAKPLYIIEGNLDRLWGRFTKQALWKYLTRLTLRYGISLFQTETLQETAQLCQLLEAQFTEDRGVFLNPTGSERVSYTQTISVSRKENLLQPDVFLSAVLQQCSGVSATSADAIVRAAPCLEKVMGMSEKELAGVQVSEKRRLGPAVAKRLWGLLHHQPAI